MDGIEIVHVVARAAAEAVSDLLVGAGETIDRAELVSAVTQATDEALARLQEREEAADDRGYSQAAGGDEHDDNQGEELQMGQIRRYAPIKTRVV